MIPLLGVKLPEGDAILLTETIVAATTNLKNPKHTDVYTTYIPSGLTVDMTLSKFWDLWLDALVNDLDIIEVDESVH